MHYKKKLPHAAFLNFLKDILISKPSPFFHKNNFFVHAKSSCDG